MTQEEMQEYEERFEIISCILDSYDLKKERPGAMIISLLLSLPQCVQRIDHGQNQITRAKHDLGTVLNKSAELLSEISNKISATDFESLRRTVCELNLQFTPYLVRKKDEING